LKALFQGINFRQKKNTLNWFYYFNIYDSFGAYLIIYVFLGLTLIRFDNYTCCIHSSCFELSEHIKRRASVTKDQQERNLWGKQEHDHCFIWWRSSDVVWWTHVFTCKTRFRIWCPALLTAVWSEPWVFFFFFPMTTVYIHDDNLI
jgi:hypothetical protein